MIKAFNALPVVGVVDNPEGWLFRIAHNTALDFLRHRGRGPTMQNERNLDMIAAPDSPDWNHEVVAMSLRTFMRLPALQRSAVILTDVLGHSLAEVASITGVSEPAAKSDLRPNSKHFDGRWSQGRCSAPGESMGYCGRYVASARLQGEKHFRTINVQWIGQWGRFSRSGSSKNQ